MYVGICALMYRYVFIPLLFRPSNAHKNHCRFLTVQPFNGRGGATPWLWSKAVGWDVALLAAGQMIFSWENWRSEVDKLVWYSGKWTAGLRKKSPDWRRSLQLNQPPPGLGFQPLIFQGLLLGKVNTPWLWLASWLWAVGCGHIRSPLLDTNSKLEQGTIGNGWFSWWNDWRHGIRKFFCARDPAESPPPWWPILYGMQVWIAHRPDPSNGVRGLEERLEGPIQKAIYIRWRNLNNLLPS